MMRLLVLLLIATDAAASSGRGDYTALALLATLIATVIAVYWVKKTPAFDKSHLKIIGFSVYFWIVVFAEVIVYGAYRFLIKLG